MAYTRCTNATYGIYEKYRDPETGKQRERCLVRLGPYPTPEEALQGYSGRIKHLRKLVKQLLPSYCFADRHERVMAQFEIERLRPKLKAVRAFIAGQAQPPAAHPAAMDL